MCIICSANADPIPVLALAPDAVEALLEQLEVRADAVAKAGCATDCNSGACATATDCERETNGL